MKINPKKISLVGIIVFILFGWLTKRYWLPLLIPRISTFLEENSEIIQSMDSLVNIAIIVAGAIFAYFRWFRKKPIWKEKFDEPPLVQISLEELFVRLGKYGGTIPWIDRKATSIQSLRGNGRIAILGELKIGKTREALELIRKAIDNDLIAENRVFIPSPSLRHFDQILLKQSLEMTMDLNEPILIFIDDLTHTFSKEGLLLIDIVIDVLSHCKDFYFIATARDDEIENVHKQWIKNKQFSITRLQRFSKNQTIDFLNGASKTFGIRIQEEAKEIFTNTAQGFPEQILISFRFLLAKSINQVDKDLAVQVSFQSILDSWLSTRRYIEERKPTAIYIIKSLAAFNAALVSPYPSMVISYARYLWKGDNVNRWSIIENRQLVDAAEFLSKFDFTIVSGQFLFPEIAVERIDSYESARNELGKYLLNYYYFFKTPWIRKLFKATLEQRYCLFDMAIAAQERGEFTESVKYYSAILDLYNVPWIYINRGSAYGELQNLKLAESDFNKAIELFGSKYTPVSIYYNRSLVYINKKDYSRALEDIEFGLKSDPVNPSLLRNKGIVFTELGKFDEALLDFNQAIDKLSDGFEKAYTYYSRGNLFAKSGNYGDAIKDYSIAINMMPGNIRNYTLTGIYRMRAAAYETTGERFLAIKDYSQAIVLEPDNIFIYFSRAVAYMELQKYKEAIDDIDRIISIDQRFPMAYFIKAQIYTNTRDNDKAIQNFTLAIKYFEEDKGRAMAYVHRGIVFAELGDVESALKDYYQAINLDKNYSFAYLNRASLYEKTGQFEKVVTDCTKALEIEESNENNIRLFNMRGSAFDELGKFESAMADFESVIIIDKKNSLAYMNLGITYFKQNEYEKALTYLKMALRYTPELWEAYINRANVYLAINEFTKAINDLNRAIKNVSDPSIKARALFVRGNAFKLKDLIDRALKDYSQSIELHIIYPELGLCYFNRAFCYWVKGNLVNAEDDLKRAINLRTDIVPAYLLLGTIHEKTGETEQAIIDIENAFIYSTNDVERIEAYKFRGRLYAESRDYKNSLLDFNQAIKLDPNNEIHYLNRGNTLFVIGKFDEALTDFDRAIKINVNYPEAYHNRGNVYLRKKEYEKALVDFDRAIQFFSNENDKASPWRNKAICLLNMDRREESQYALDQAERIAPEDVFLYATKLEISYKMGDLNEVLKLIELCETKSIYNADFGFFKSLVLFQLGKAQEALPLISAYIDSSPAPITFHVMGSYLDDLINKISYCTELEEAIKVVNEYKSIVDQYVTEVFVCCESDQQLKSTL